MFGKNQARPQHYGFIHFALRQFAFEDPGYCLTVLLSPKGQELVELLWDHVQQFCDETERDPELSTKDIELFPALLKGQRGVIVQMPPPKRPTEAYFAALLPIGRPPRFRYFTLSIPDGGKADGPTALGEWMPDNRYIYHGEGPPPAMDALIGVIAERFAAS